MRRPEYLSPSSISVFGKNREEFYLRYLADNRPMRAPQTRPMSVGSAFDAFIKSYLYKKYYGNEGPDGRYNRDQIFESQVEEHNRDWARSAGEYVFKKYVRSGALADLLLELDASASPPRFEFELTGRIETPSGIWVPLLGKPDIFFISKKGARVIYDWKVNGFVSQANQSPTKGFLLIRDGWSALDKRKPSRGNGMQHKDCVMVDFRGIRVNGILKLEECNPDWARQLSIYAWLLGEPPGSENLVIGIDQIVGSEPDPNHPVVPGYPWLRIAQHRSLVSQNYQLYLLNVIDEIWTAIESGHIFTDRSKEESDAKCVELDKIAESLSGDDEITRFINEASRW